MILSVACNVAGVVVVVVVAVIRGRPSPRARPLLRSPHHLRSGWSVRRTSRTIITDHTTILGRSVRHGALLDGAVPAGSVRAVLLVHPHHHHAHLALLLLHPIHLDSYAEERSASPYHHHWTVEGG
jgi:hypothetical protein